MTKRPWTIKEILRVTTEYLEGKAVESPRLSSEILLAHALGVERIDLYMRLDQPLTPDEVSRYRDLVRRRSKREPVQYITRRQEFWSLDFEVGPGVLIPRAETELLVEQVLALRRAGDLPFGDGELRLLDLGTGCGAVAIALCMEIPEATLWATDISDQALETARANAERHGVLDRMVLNRGDLFDAVPGGMFQAVISNPPYVPSDQMKTLPPEVGLYEPTAALDGGEGGTAVVERIIREAPKFLFPGGWLILEMSPEQAASAEGMVVGSGSYQTRLILKDYSRRDRVLMAERSK